MTESFWNLAKDPPGCADPVAVPKEDKFEADLTAVNKVTLVLDVRKSVKFFVSAYRHKLKEMASLFDLG